MPAARTALPARLVPPDFRSTPPAPPARTGLATASLVLGIASLVANVLLLPTVLAVVFGVVALAKGTPARVRAILGIVLGLLGVVVLGIVAAIAIPLLVGLQGQAIDSGARAVLANDKTALTGWAAAHGGDLPQRIDPAALAPYGWDDSPVVRRLTYATGTGGTAGSFCLIATVRSGASFVTTTHTPISAAAVCPASW